MAGIGAKVAVTLEEHTGYEFVGYVVSMILNIVAGSRHILTISIGYKDQRGSL